MTQFEEKSQAISDRIQEMDFGIAVVADEPQVYFVCKADERQLIMLLANTLAMRPQYVGAFAKSLYCYLRRHGQDKELVKRILEL